MRMSVGPTARGTLLVTAATLGFASLGTLSNLAYAAGMSPPMFVALRAALGSALLAGLLAVRPDRRVALRAIPDRERRLLLLAIALNGMFNLALFAAFDAMAVPVVLAIYFTYPALVAVVSVALGRERLAAVRLAGLAIAVAGAVLIVTERVGGADAVPLGILLAAGAAACQALYLVVSRSGFPSVPAEQAITLVLVGGFAMAVGTIAVTHGLDAVTGEWLTDPASWLAVGAAAILGTAFAKVWVLRGVRLLGGTRTAVIMLGEPVGGAVLAAIVLDQVLTPILAVGGALIVAGALAVQRPAPGRAGMVE